MAPISILNSFLSSLLSMPSIFTCPNPCINTIPSTQDLNHNRHQTSLPPSPQTPIPGQTTIRDAQLSDLEDVTNILADTFAGTPAWDYGYQYREEYPAYHRFCLAEQIREEFERRDAESVWVKVLEVEDGQRDQDKVGRRDGEKGKGRRSRVVSVAVWRVMDQNAPGYWDPSPSLNADSSGRREHPKTEDDERFDCSLHLDTNLTRLTSFQTQYAKLRRPYIEDAYLKQLHLEELATHPDYQGRGYAAELVRWGMKEAKMLGLGPVTLISTPTGHGLYRKLGFVDLGEVLVKRLDGGGKVWFEAMRWGG